MLLSNTETGTLLSQFHIATRTRRDGRARQPGEMCNRASPHATALSVSEGPAQSTMTWMISVDTKKMLLDGKVMCEEATNTLWEFNGQKVPPWELKQHFCQSHHLTYITAVGYLCALFRCVSSKSVRMRMSLIKQSGLSSCFLITL